MDSADDSILWWAIPERAQYSCHEMSNVSAYLHSAPSDLLAPVLLRIAKFPTVMLSKYVQPSRYLFYLYTIVTFV